MGMRITNKSFLRLVVGALKKYTAKDKRNIMTAIPVTISKFGPSGSLKSKNINLENRIDVAPNISKGILFDLKYEIFILDIVIYFLLFVNIYLSYYNRVMPSCQRCTGVLRFGAPFGNCSELCNFP